MYKFKDLSQLNSVQGNDYINCLPSLTLDRQDYSTNQFL